MTVDCPECGAHVEADPGSEAVCPACLTAFVAPVAARAVRHFDVQLPDDTVLPGLTRFAIREAIYTARIPITARVRETDAAAGASGWQPVHAVAEFAAVYRLLELEPPVPAGARKLAGWKSVAGPAPRRASRPRGPRPASRSDAERVDEWVRRLPVPVLGAAVVGLVLLALVGLMFFLARS